MRIKQKSLAKYNAHFWVLFITTTCRVIHNNVVEKYKNLRLNLLNSPARPDETLLNTR